MDTRTSTSRYGAPHAPVVLTHWRGPNGMAKAGARPFPLVGIGHDSLTLKLSQVSGCASGERQHEAK